MTEENIYAPPVASLELDADVAVQPDFYIVSKRKFNALFFATFGMYQVYWFYKNWQLYQKSTGANIWPVMRAVFTWFFIHSLFSKVERKIVLEKKAIAWSPGLNATLLVVLLFVSNVFARIDGAHSQAIVVFLIVPMALVYSNVQGKINAACDDPKGMSNDKFTPGNYVWMTIGVIWWGFVAFGWFLTMSGS